MNSMSNSRPLPEGYTLGADPELFIFLNGGPVSAHEFLPGTKAKPFPVPGGAIQVDGTAAEFNINPAKTFEEFNDNIESVLYTMRQMLPPGAELRAVPVVVWPEEYFRDLPWVCQELGCMPDYNAWTGKKNPKPRLKESPTLRTAAGHIHIGWTADANLQDLKYIADCREMIQLMDYYVGSWSCDIDPDTTRRKLYGKAGACRYKPYGVEYRTLSNFWVLDESLRLEVWNRTAEACGEHLYPYSEGGMAPDMVTIAPQLIARINGDS